MPATPSSRKAPRRMLADLPGAVTAGAFHIARETGGRSVGVGVGLFAFAAAHVALFTLLSGDALIRRLMD